MAKIEELPAEEFDEAMNLEKNAMRRAEDEVVSGKGNRDPVFKDIGREEPPKDKPFEAVLSGLSQVPIFMDNLDLAGGVDSENLDLEALQALQYEGTKAEIGRGFKEQGNEVVKTKQWADAKEFYSKALAVLIDKTEGRWEKGDDVEVEAREVKELTEQCYVNRALSHLELKNYRSTTLDCAAALRLNPSNIKAYYRSALALLALSKLNEASDVCFRGLKLEPDNGPLRSLSEKVQAQVKVEETKNRRRKNEDAKKQKTRFLLKSALQAREITVKGSQQTPDLEDAEIHLSPDPLDPRSTLVFPVVFLYPMHAQSDFVKAFGEQDTFLDHLSSMFPLPWDENKQYQVGSVDCFMETGSGGMAKVGKKVSLLEALNQTKHTIVDGLIKVNVVPNALTGKWVEEMKKRKNR